MNVKQQSVNATSTQQTIGYDYYAVAGVLNPHAIEYIVTLSQTITPEDCYYATALLYEPHITVARGLHTINPAKLATFLPKEQPLLTIKAVDVLKPANQDYDILALTIDSPALTALNQSILLNTPHTKEYKDILHVTLGFVQKGEGDVYTKTLNVETAPPLSISHFIYYDKNGVTHTLKKEESTQ